MVTRSVVMPLIIRRDRDTIGGDTICRKENVVNSRELHLLNS